MGPSHDAVHFVGSDPAGHLAAPPDVLLFTYSRPEQPWFRRTLIRVVERLSGRARLERMYRDWIATRDPGETIFAAGLRVLDISARIDGQDLPAKGGLLILANHPFGIIDGLLLGDLVHRLRGDVKIITHSLLCQPPEAQGLLLPVDFGPGPEARQVSIATRRQAADWLAAGHAVVIFPAGSVATSVRPFGGSAVDADWHPFITRLAAVPGVATVPVFVHGQNSRLFQIASHYSYPLRVALIFRETRAWIGRRVRVSVGAAVTVVPGDRQAVVKGLRAACYRLGGQDGEATFVWPRWIRW